MSRVLFDVAWIVHVSTADFFFIKKTKTVVCNGWDGTAHLILELKSAR